MATASRLAAFPKGKGGRSSVSGHVVTVFGCTGFIGKYVVNRLGRCGSQVVLPYRQDQTATRHLRVMGDLGQLIFTPFHLQHEESIYNAVKHSTVVINLCGRNFSRRLSQFSQRDVHVDGAERLARISREAGVERFIHVSTLGASQSGDLQFHIDKADGEEAVRKAFPSATILRPSNVLGPEDRFLNFFGHRAYWKISPLLKEQCGATKMPVYVVDVAKAAVQCVEDPSTAGQTYELFGPKTYKMEELVHYLFRILLRRFVPVRIPEKLYLNVYCAPTEFVLSRRPFTTRNEAQLIYYPNVRAPGMPGLLDLGITPTPLEEYALYTLRRYRHHQTVDVPMDEVERVDGAEKFI